MSKLNQQDGKLVGIEVSAARLKAVCLSADGKLIDRETVSLNDRPLVGDYLIEFIKSLKSKFGNFDKIGIAVTGLLDSKSNRVKFSAHLPEQSEIDFVSEIKNGAGVDAVLENDANAGAYGEYILGAGRGSRDMFYVTLGAGVGGAIIFNGEIWRGAAGFAGEFGYTTINSEGMKLEEVASAKNIVRRIRNRFHQDPTSSLGSIIKFDEESITIADVLRAANSGDDFTQMMLERTGNYVGIGIANIINLLNIEKIVVGGEVLEGEDFVLNALKQRARELSFAPNFESTQILKGKLDGLASAIGVALLSGKTISPAE